METTAEILQPSGSVLTGLSRLSLNKGELVNKRYRIGEQLGKGGFGVVYAAFDQMTGCDIALKFLYPDLGADLERLKRIQREILMARQGSTPRSGFDIQP